uniref:Nuclear receptor domain-containing protein n=1 Tax=Caenorhabditis japonica TaxID=281687 RepID=A0A8R1DWZ9_CAEJA
MVPNPCYVCSSPANECHFGSRSQICRACSAFFRRYVLSPKSAIKCRNDVSCRIFYKDPKICRFCRMEKCVSAGMKTSAVQPPREKYSEDKVESEANSCYSASPYTYEVQSSSREIPCLLRLSSNFQNLERIRKLEFQNQEPPKSRNMGELIEILRKDIRLVSTFVEGAYPELAHLGKLEKKLLFLNFFIKYMLVEPPFLGLTTGRKEMLLPNGDHYDEDIGRFYTGHLNSINLTEKSADELFKPYWEEYRRTVIDDVWFIKPDVFEFLTVSGLILWDTGLEDLSDQSIDLCRRMREKLVTEIHFYYKNIRKVVDPCLRLGQIMMLLSSVQKSFGKYQEELEMCGFFEIYKDLDTETCQLIKDSLQL